MISTRLRWSRPSNAKSAGLKSRIHKPDLGAGSLQERMPPISHHRKCEWKSLRDSGIQGRSERSSVGLVPRSNNSLFNFASHCTTRIELKGRPVSSTYLWQKRP